MPASTVRRLIGLLTRRPPLRWARVSILRNRSAPSGQVVRLHAFGELQGLLDRMLEVGLHGLALDPSAQEIGPQEFAERRRVLGEPAGTPQFTRQRTERIVDELGHGLGEILVGTPPAPVVVRM